jgi:uncharacterized protein
MWSTAFEVHVKTGLGARRAWTTGGRATDPLMVRRRMRTFDRARPILLGLAVLLMGFGRAGPPALIEAARKGDHVALRALIEQGADVNERYGDGTTALHWASFLNDSESADLLIRAGANANAVNDLGATPLWAAAVNGSAPMARRLLAAGAEPNSALLLGETVLMQASRTGNPDVVELLLAAGADVHARGPIQHTTPCPMPGVYEFQGFEPNVHPGIRPAELKRISTMRCGLQAGNQTALMWAVSNRNPQVVALLLAHGADVHDRSDVWSHLQAVPPFPLLGNQRVFLHGGSTAIIFAAQVGDLVSTKLLVEAGADVNDVNAWGNSAIALAAFANAGDVVRYLLEQGADPNPPPGEEVLAPLHSAIMYRDDTTVAALLSHGADPNAPLRTWNPRVRSSGARWINFYPGQLGATPIWLAARWGTPAIMRLLADHGADPSAVHTSVYYGGGNSGIDAYVFTQHTTILMAALNQGGPGNSWVRPGPGAGGAARRTEDEVLESVKLAVEWGVDVNAVNDASRTCEVAWEHTYRPGVRLPCVPGAPRIPGEDDSDQNIAPRTALDAAIGLRYDSIVDFLRAHGATNSDGMPARAPERGGL